MTTFLQVCVGLLLVACAKGIWAPYDDVLTCARTEFLNSCASPLLTALDVTSIDAVRQSSMDTFCNHQEAFVTWTGCVEKEYRQCLPQDKQGLIQTPARTRAALQALCTHRNQINLTCTQQNYLRSRQYPSTCDPLRSWGSVVRVEDFISKACRYFDDLSRCYVRAGLDCDNHSVCAFDEAYRKSYPPACGVAGLCFSTSALLLSAFALLLNNITTLL